MSQKSPSQQSTIDKAEGTGCNTTVDSDSGPTRKTADKAGQETSADEIGGRNGPDPTRYGDWEKNGRCIDF